MSLTKENILSADDLRREKIAVPEWGGDVYVRVLTGLELQSFVEREKVDNAEFLTAVLCDEDGKNIFCRDDVAALNGKCGRVIQNLTRKALFINGLTADSVKELEKN